jgi:hypothetical protein
MRDRENLDERRATNIDGAVVSTVRARNLDR